MVPAAPPEHLPPLTPEAWELLLLAGRLDLAPGDATRLAALARTALPWANLLAWGERLGALPLLHHHLAAQPEAAPAEVLTRLEAAYRKTSLRNLRSFALLREILAKAEAAGVPVLCLKGSVLAPDLYGDLGLRPMGDLDLLVRPADAPGLEAILAGMGAFRSPDGRRRDPAEVPASVQEVIGHGLPWFFPSVCRVEIHRHLLAEGIRDDGWLQVDLWAGARTRDLDGVPQRGLGREHLVLHLASHLAHHLEEGAVHLYWFTDLGALLHREGPALDRAALAALARRLGLEAGCREVFGLLGAAWDGPGPDDARGAFPRLAAALSVQTVVPAGLPGLTGLGAIRRVRGLRNRIRYLGEVFLPAPWKLELAFGRSRPRPLLLLAWPWAKAWRLARTLVRRAVG